MFPLREARAIELDERCRVLLEEIIPPLEGRYHDVLMCSHGALIKGVVRRLLGRPLAQFWTDPPQPQLLLHGAGIRRRAVPARGAGTSLPVRQNSR